jgi:hypothetical protein
MLDNRSPKSKGLLKEEVDRSGRRQLGYDFILTARQLSRRRIAAITGSNVFTNDVTRMMVQPACVTRSTISGRR